MCGPDFNIDVEGDVTRRAPAALDRDLSKEWAEPQQRQSRAKQTLRTSTFSQSYEDGGIQWLFTRSNSRAPKHGNTPDKETLAIADSFKHWRHYLEGSKQKIELLSDHHNLQGFLHSMDVKLVGFIIRRHMISLFGIGRAKNPANAFISGAWFWAC
jgi:RNase H-like domain found in reverse transcriptase